jgi:hypothetical protein
MKHIPTYEIHKIMKYSNRVFIDGILVKSRFENVDETIQSNLLRKYLDKIIHYEFNPDIFELDLFT